MKNTVYIVRSKLYNYLVGHWDVDGWFASLEAAEEFLSQYEGEYIRCNQRVGGEMVVGEKYTEEFFYRVFEIPVY